MNQKTYYDENKSQIIEKNKRYYHEMIGNMTNTELKAFREKKKEYYKEWYSKNRFELANRRRGKNYPKYRYTKTKTKEPDCDVKIISTLAEIILVKAPIRFDI